MAYLAMKSGAAALAALLFGLSGVAAAGAAGGSAAAAPAEVAAAGPSGVPSSWQLEGVVVLSRHGLRAPLTVVRCKDVSPPGNCLNAQSAERWPHYRVPEGYLLPEGVPRLETLGAFYRTVYGALFDSTGCPTDLKVVSDIDQRTKRTARALLEGMFPGCSIKRSTASYLFGAPPASCAIDDTKAEHAMQRRLGGPWEKVANTTLKAPLAAMDSTLGQFKPAACSYFGADAPCSLNDVPASPVAPWGPISAADQLSENFLMQYGAGFPLSEVAWGKLPQTTGMPIEEALKFVNAIHALDFAAGSLPRYVAVHFGSTMMNAVLGDLQAIAGGEADAPRFVLYSGHDGNILSVAGMLGLEWTLDSYQPFQTPPGGAVAFELWRTGEGALQTRLRYFAQTLGQMRANEPLTRRNPPAIAVMPVEGCASSGDKTGACAWSEFSRIAGRRIMPSCIATGEPTTLH